MVNRALYRGPQFICVDLNDELMDGVGDFRGMPIRRRFPELRGSGLFSAMDRVYLSGQAEEMDWTSLVDGEEGTMLILPWLEEERVVGVGLHFHPCGRSFDLANAALRHAPVVSAVLLGLGLG